MNYQRILKGAAIGSAAGGLAFLAFHPAGKRIRKKVMDLGLDVADTLIDLMRTTIPLQEEGENGLSDHKSQSRSAAAEL